DVLQTRNTFIPHWKCQLLTRKDERTTDGSDLQERQRIKSGSDATLNMLSDCLGIYDYTNSAYDLIMNLHAVKIEPKIRLRIYQWFSVPQQIICLPSQDMIIIF
ncbi:MAG: hypothetical protein ACRDDF_11755, partial [Aeromonas sp.]